MKEIERAVEIMWERYGEPLTLGELADGVFLSRFYFCRAFRAATGTSPGRFLAAIRLTKAKDLLLKTSMSVTDIAYHVGYNSLGTFTSRFTTSVGLPPGRYRNAALSGSPALNPRRSGPRAGERVVRGHLSAPPQIEPTKIYVATFRQPISHDLPHSCDVVHGAGEFSLAGVPAGDWIVRAMAVPTASTERPAPGVRRPLLVGHAALGKAEQSRIRIAMRPMRSTDIPILLAVPELDGVRRRPHPEPEVLLRRA